MDSYIIPTVWKYLNIWKGPVTNPYCHQPHIQHLVHNGSECKSRVTLGRYSPREHPNVANPQGESNNQFVLATKTSNHIDTCQPTCSTHWQKYIAQLLATIRHWESDLIAGSTFPISWQKLKTVIHQHPIHQWTMYRSEWAELPSKFKLTNIKFFSLYKSLQYNHGDQHYH
jgi:hypothetical protein